MGEILIQLHLTNEKEEKIKWQRSLTDFPWSSHKIEKEGEESFVSVRACSNNETQVPKGNFRG